MKQTMSQKLARDSFDKTETFEAKNDVAELFIQTAAVRNVAVRDMNEERNINAMLNLTMLAKREIADGKGMSPEEVRSKLREARE